jgi:hypothetical protein
VLENIIVICLCTSVADEPICGVDDHDVVSYEGIKVLGYA